MKDIVVINIFNWPGDGAYVTIYRTLMNFLTTGKKNSFGMTFHLSLKKIMNKKLAILAREDMFKRV